MKSFDELSTQLRTHGLRVTPQRRCIIGLLVGDTAHPTVDALYERARRAMPTISLKTVYQTVHDLEALGEVRLLDVGTGAVRVDPNVEAEHHHLVCMVCGRVDDVVVDASTVALPRQQRRDFTVVDVEVVFRGRCRSCDDRAQ